MQSSLTREVAINMSNKHKLLSRAKEGGTESPYQLDKEYLRATKSSYRKVAPWYTKAVDQRYLEAQFELRYHYSRGLGVKKDEVEEFYEYRQAAEQGHIEAQYVLGVVYLTN